jgi:outer membrane biosynthesis protein TonB
MKILMQKLMTTALVITCMLFAVSLSAQAQPDTKAAVAPEKTAIETFHKWQPNAKLQPQLKTPIEMKVYLLSFWCESPCIVAEKAVCCDPPPPHKMIDIRNEPNRVLLANVEPKSKN